ncbi:5-formyltetrahydrofolate cyclo-ligase [Azoarcus sp. L1K30]|uniref:5-formyltetrahydrofolate cyclo-ligase n=1 Tax=Azoarcus sp. L1K30 TaxID=2820277 RepID=UPI001B81B9AD|nr:5-formyltetrahydrofolate cyclo-ligase [Azoarcus sp. L1K30]MBR0566454.1 5-formyltetrahydrofolate cyclo-ligase [Azoarcus sp. L1K30]
MRDRALVAREALPSEVRAVMERAIEGHLDGLVEQLRPRSLAFCWPYRAEPDLRAWVTRWLGAGEGRLAALPVVLEKDAPLVFRAWTPGATMQADRHGIPFPVAGVTVLPDVVLVPLNAFDAGGFRLGYGGGYFDRTLAAKRLQAIGVGFELGRVDSVLPQQHDRAMDWLVTEAGAFATPVQSVNA